MAAVVQAELFDGVGEGRAGFVRWGCVGAPDWPGQGNVAVGNVEGFR